MKKKRKKRAERLAAAYEQVTEEAYHNGERRADFLRSFVRLSPAMLLLALLVWLICLPVERAMGPLDPVTIGAWTAVGTFAGGVLGTVTTVVATERSEVEVALFEKMMRGKGGALKWGERAVLRRQCDEQNVRPSGESVSAKDSVNSLRRCKHWRGQPTKFSYMRLV